MNELISALAEIIFQLLGVRYIVQPNEAKSFIEGGREYFDQNTFYGIPQKMRLKIWGYINCENLTEQLSVNLTLVVDLVQNLAPDSVIAGNNAFLEIG